jgi:glycosyltransferase involved in cell wall biosynthesis
MIVSAMKVASRSGLQLRIEMVLPSLVVAGMETMTRDLVLGLSALGHGVGVTCLEDEGALAEGLRENGVAVSLVPCPGIGANFRPDAALGAHFATLGCEVVHTHNGVWAKATLAAQAAGIPAVINTLHGFAHGEPWFHEPFRWWGARHTDKIVAVSASLRDHLIEKTHVPASRVTVLPNGIDTDRFAPGRRSGALRERFAIHPDAPLVGCIARLDPVKEHALLLAAFSRILLSHPDARLVLVGDGPLRGALEAQVAATGLSHAVLFAGNCPDPVPIYRDLDAFALASRSEGTSISILEALASGLPVIATAVGGTPDLLCGGECGLLVPSGDAEALANAIIRVLDEPALKAHLAEAGRARAVSAFSQTAMVEAYETLYWSVLENKRVRLAVR